MADKTPCPATMSCIQQYSVLDGKSWGTGKQGLGKEADTGGCTVCKLSQSFRRHTAFVFILQTPLGCPQNGNVTSDYTGQSKPNKACAPLH